MLRYIILLCFLVMSIQASEEASLSELPLEARIAKGLQKEIIVHVTTYGVTEYSSKWFVNRLYTPGALRWGMPTALIGDKPGDKYSTSQINKDLLEKEVCNVMHSVVQNVQRLKASNFDIKKGAD